MRTPHVAAALSVVPGRGGSAFPRLTCNGRRSVSPLAAAGDTSYGSGRRNVTVRQGRLADLGLSGLSWHGAGTVACTGARDGAMSRVECCLARSGGDGGAWGRNDRLLGKPLRRALRFARWRVLAFACRAAGLEAGSRAGILESDRYPPCPPWSRHQSGTELMSRTRRTARAPICACPIASVSVRRSPSLTGKCSSAYLRPGGWLSGSDRPLRWPTGI